MTTKHTPGPWRVVIGCNFVDIVSGPENPGGPWHRQTDAGIAQVQIRWPFRPTRKHKANGRLLAAAPDLLTQLRSLCDAVAPDLHGCGRGVAEVFDASRALIAKVDGVEP